MIVLSDKFVGLLHVCSQCGAVLAYKGEDVYVNGCIYCPVCHSMEKCNMEVYNDSKDSVQKR